MAETKRGATRVTRAAAGRNVTRAISADAKRNTTRILSDNPHAGKKTFSNRFLTGEFGEPVAVRVDMVEATPDIIINHNLRTTSDYDQIDFFIPLTLFAVIYALNFMNSFLLGTFAGVGGMGVILILEVALIKDLRARMKRRPSGPALAGLVQPYNSSGWGWAFLIYLLSLPLVLGSMWLNQVVYEAVYGFLYPPGTVDFQMEFEYAGSAAMHAVLATVVLFLLFMFIQIVVFAPISEELWFRGIGLASYQRTGSRLRAVFWTSVIFGALHGPSRMIFVSMLGLVLATIRFRTGSLYCCMVIHALHNSGIIVYFMYNLFW